MTQHAVVSLSSTTAIKVTPNGMHSGLDISVQNVNSSGYVYVGGEGVTTTNYGFRISPNSAISFELDGHDSIYLVSSSNGLSAAVITTILADQ